MRSDLIAEFAKLLGSRGVRAPYDFEATVAGVVVEPADLDELSEVVRKCEGAVQRYDVYRAIYR